MRNYDSANYAVPTIHHDIAKAFLLGLDVHFETSEMTGNECCFALYDLNVEQASSVGQFFTQECEATLLPF